MQANNISIRAAAITSLGSKPYPPVRPGCSGNCTYTISFNAPTLQCTSPEDELPADARKALEDGLADSTAFGAEYLAAGYGPDPADYPSQLLDSLTWRYADGLVLDGEYPTSLAIFVFNPPMNISCSMYNATYTVTNLFNESLAYTSVENIAVLGLFPQSMGTYTLDDMLSNLSPAKRAALNYFGIARAFFQPLSGKIIVGGGGFGSNIIADPGLTVMQSPLAVMGFGRTVEFKPHLGKVIEDLFTNTTLSLATLDVGTTGQTTCNTNNPINVFHYSPIQLLAAYGAGLAVALFCSAWGIVALFANGKGNEAGFASFFEATRHSHLGTLDEKEKIRYGSLRELDVVGFGRDHDVSAVRD